jgi:Tfp pilus assembly protein PilF
MGCFALAILSKPMAITLPLVLLLLDIWPLKRIEIDASVKNAVKNAVPAFIEKLPLLVMAFIGGGIAFFAQRMGGGLGSINEFPVSSRVSNALLSYMKYTGKTIYPKNLTVFYPFETYPSLILTGFSLLCFAGVTGLAVILWRKRPYVATGWLWFTLSLVPVIGIFRIGDFAMADRYMYIPITGLFLLAVWCGADLMRRFHVSRWISCLLLILVLSGFSLVTCRQIGYWKNNETLYAHALTVTRNNHMAHYGLAHEMASKGRFAEAVFHFEKASDLKPKKATILLFLGRALAVTGRFSEASKRLKQAVQIAPGSVEIRHACGIALILKEDYSEGMENLHQVLVNQKDFIRQTDKRVERLVHSRYKKGRAFEKNREIEKAQETYEAILSMAPMFLPAMKNLSRIYLDQGEIERAFAIYAIPEDRSQMINTLLGGHEKWMDALKKSQGRFVKPTL